MAERLGRLGRSGVEDIYLLTETAGVLLVGIVLGEIYVAGQLEVPDHRLLYASPMAVCLLALVLAYRAKGLYNFSRLATFSASVGPVLLGLVRAFVTLIVLGFVFNVANDFSRVWVVGWFLGAVPVVLLLRALAARLCGEMVAGGAVLQNVAVYGAGRGGERVCRQLSEAGTGVGVVGPFGPSTGRDGRRDPSDATSAGDLDALVRHVRTHRVDAIVVVVDPAAAPRSRAAVDVDAVMAALGDLPVEVRLHVVTHGSAPLGSSQADGLRYFDVQSAPLSRGGRALKTVLDRSGAAVLLVLLAPVMAVAALAVRLDGPGPVLFVQSRHGFNRRIFKVWKFRTMRVMEEGEAVVQARRGDARVTRVGRFLRRTSIDELPQLVNVLRGDMSLVGPRPHPVNLDAHYETIVERYAARHKVKPGITGLAQINGYRGPTPEPDLMRRRLEMDLRYIENWSLWLDIRILAATPFLGIVSRNAV